MRREITSRNLLLLVLSCTFAVAMLAPWPMRAGDEHMGMSMPRSI